METGLEVVGWLTSTVRDRKEELGPGAFLLHPGPLCPRNGAVHI